MDDGNKPDRHLSYKVHVLLNYCDFYINFYLL